MINIVILHLRGSVVWALQQIWSLLKSQEKRSAGHQKQPVREEAAWLQRAIWEWTTWIYLPVTRSGPSWAAQRPASPLPASGCAARSCRWTSWGSSHLCPRSRTLCAGRSFHKLQRLGAKRNKKCGACGTGGLSSKASGWRLQQTHQNTTHIPQVPTDWELGSLWSEPS